MIAIIGSLIRVRAESLRRHWPIPRADCQPCSGPDPDGCIARQPDRFGMRSYAERAIDVPKPRDQRGGSGRCSPDLGGAPGCTTWASIQALRSAPRYSPTTDATSSSTRHTGAHKYTPLAEIKRRKQREKESPCAADCSPAARKRLQWGCLRHARPPPASSGGRARALVTRTGDCHTPPRPLPPSRSRMPAAGRARAPGVRSGLQPAPRREPGVSRMRMRPRPTLRAARPLTRDRRVRLGCRAGVGCLLASVLTSCIPLARRSRVEGASFRAVRMGSPRVHRSVFRVVFMVVSG